MVHCDICSRECIISEGKSGFCGQYSVKDGQLEERFADHYLVACPISVETMPILHAYPGATFLQISTLGCNLSCNGCISTVLVRDMDSGDRLMKRLTPEQVVSLACKHECLGIVFLMNDPLASYLTFTRVAREAKHRGLMVGCSTNGLFSEASLARLMPCLDFVNMGMKGMWDPVYQACGASGAEPVLRNMKTLYDGGVHVEISCMYRTDNGDELKALARYVADLSPQIPFQVMRFIPFENADLTLEPDIGDAEDFCDQLKQTLDFVYLFNSPGTTWLDTVCPSCKKTVFRRDFFGPMGAKLLPLKGSVNETGHCPHCDGDLAMKGDITAKNFMERGFEGGYPFTRALEMVEAMLNVLGLSQRSHMVGACETLLQNGGLQAFHHDIQDPDSYIKTLRRFGHILGQTERADIVSGFLEDKLALIRTCLETVSEKPRVYYAMGTPLFALNPGRMENRLVQRAGGYSVNTELTGEGRPGCSIDVKQLNRLNPDVIFVSAFISETIPAFYKRCLTLGVDVNAVRNRRIYAHPAPGWDFGSPRWILGLMFITATLHPDHFSPDIMAEAQDVYRVFYDMDFSLPSINRSFSKPSKDFRHDRYSPRSYVQAGAMERQNAEKNDLNHLE
ncbi:MAG: radical SAM protein [Proteobacteria bacterium]|nr:radical SAM protein [Pseudomonadota bacterium]